MTDHPGFTGLSLSPLTPSAEYLLSVGVGCKHRGSPVCAACPWADEVERECDYKCDKCDDNGYCPCSDPAMGARVDAALGLEWGPRQTRLPSSQRQRIILDHVREHPHQAAREIARALGMARSSIGMYLQRLRRLGAVETSGAVRVSTRGHRRQVVVYVAREEAR